MAIKVLSPFVYNRISAGEVVERPASVVKELIENSIDAGATKIKLEIEEGGIKKIIVSDNGCGIEKDDLPLAFLPHATSKIAEVEDLDGIATLGFRGEALASIASVSMLSLTTKSKNSDMGFKIDASGGRISDVTEVARLNGTTLSMNNLFFNTPVRAKFLKKPKTEEGEITHLFEKFMLSHPEIDFSYFVDGKEVYNHSSGHLDEVLYLLYGREVYDNLLMLDYQEDDVVVGGYIVSPKLSRPNRTYQSLFVNSRYVENYMVSACVQGAYEPLLMKGRYPIYAIKLSIPYSRVDVNVHPNKREVKFDDGSKIFGIIRRAVEKALMSTNLIADFEFTSKEEKEWSKFHINNEENPAENTFNSQMKSKLDKLSPTEGASYMVTVDSDEMDKPFVTPKDYQKKGVDVINVPNFSSVKRDRSRLGRNRPGGRIFFDNSGDNLLGEVMIEVEKEQKKKQEQVSTEKKEIVSEKFLKVSADEIKILGVVFKTYILTEFEDAIYVVDQHAMHERQLYEKLKSEVERNNVAKQDLLVPYTFTLVSKDKEKFEDALEDIRKIGFEISNNNGKFILKSVPFVLAGINLSKFVEEVLSEESGFDKTASGLINEKLCQTACKHAIRAGDSVSKEEILYLLENMKNSVAICPHGRPIIVKITKKELEKMFKRVL